MITSSGVPNHWNGAFIGKASFQDKFKIVAKNYDELTDTYEIVVVFYAKKDTEYHFDVSQEVYNGSKSVIADEIMRQLK